MPTIVRWNGADLPEELRKLPAGRYIVDDADAQRRITAPLRR